MALKFEDLRILKTAEAVADDVWRQVARWDQFAREVVGGQLARAADNNHCRSFKTGCLSNSFGQGFPIPGVHHLHIFHPDSLYQLLKIQFFGGLSLESMI